MYTNQIAIYNKEMEFNSTYQPRGLCVEFRCSITGVTEIHDCIRLEIPQNVDLIKQDLMAKYPKCCESYLDSYGNKW